MVPSSAAGKVVKDVMRGVVNGSHSIMVRSCHHLAANNMRLIRSHFYSLWTLCCLSGNTSKGGGFKHKCQNKSTLLNTGCSPTKKKKKWRLFTSPKLLLFRKEKSQTQPHSGSKRVCKLVQSHLYLYCNSPLKILSFGKKTKKHLS